VNKIKEIVSTAFNAARHSFSFCFRNNKRDTVAEMLLLASQTVLSYCAILVMGNLISSLQGHITGKQIATFTVNDFINGGYFIPVVCFVAILFAEIVLQKFRSFISSRRRQILKIANTEEINAFKGSLDIARIRSKQFDDIERKIDELPEGWYTRISFSGEVMSMLGEVITLVTFGVSLLLTNPLYVAIIVLTAIPMAVAEFIALNRAWLLSLELIPHHKRRGVLQRVYYGSTSFLQGLMFNQMDELSKQIRQNHNHVIKVYDRLRWSNIQITLGAYLIAMTGMSIVILHSVWNTVSVGGDLGVLTIILASSRRLQGSTRDIVLQVASQWLSAKGMIIIEKEFFGMKPLIQTDAPVSPAFSNAPMIRFENVSFSYPDTDTLVLKDISFNIEPGSKVTIVGRNGSGKSSLIGLLLRHYDPTAGRIVVGDICLRNIAPPVWSDHVCALLQNFTVHERTVGEEIASSRLDAPIDMKMVQMSAKFADFEKIINEDINGYKSQIGTKFGGREFSGGEEQRLALARARYRNTPIFILDEPDAKLDPEASQRLMDNVFALTGVTVIMITQHVSRAKRSDKIIVLDAGEVVEVGRHDELIALHGKYSSMFKKDSSRLCVE